jgi:hypothetical protein
MVLVINCSLYVKRRAKIDANTKKTTTYGYGQKYSLS